MKINRKELLDNLFEFAQKDSGVVIGSPGVGKSYILSELSDCCLEQGIPAAIIRIDQIVHGTDEEIQSSLSFPTANWIEVLQKIVHPTGKKGILIFDAFDSAKDEELKKRFLSIISIAKNKLKDNWHVIVSVRTYDATKSSHLVSLFPASTNYVGAISCRNLSIPELNDNELKSYFENEPQIERLFYESQLKLQEVLRKPFFLHLYESIIKSGLNDNSKILKIIKSEIELLDIFWRLVIVNKEDGISRELLLKELTMLMVSNKSLAVDRLVFLSSYKSEIPIVESLISDNVIAVNGFTMSKISYAHNILFDFAVSKLLIKDNKAELLDFVQIDATRPYFLRPSFIYFFSRLWYFENAIFYKIYRELHQTEDSKIALFTKLLPSTVIATEFDTINQLEPIFEFDNVDNILVDILQALKFISDLKNTAPKILLLEYLSNKLNYIILPSFAVVLYDVITQAKFSGENDDSNDRCGISARNLLSYILIQKEESYNLNVDAIGFSRGVELVARTYKTDPIDSRKVLESVLNLISTPNFEIRYISSLCEYTKFILDIDPEFVADIYRRVFHHEEDSHDETTMTSSILMNFKSNRHQDFDLCLYRLNEFFSIFLKSFPKVAIPVGLEIVNAYVAKIKRVERVSDNEMLSNPYFEFDGVNCRFVSDYSSVWHQDVISYPPLKLTESIIEYLQDLINDHANEMLKNCIKLYVQHSWVGYNWKKILELATNNAATLHDILFPILLVKQILYSSDTIYEVGNFITNSINFYSSDQIHQIETAILDLLSTRSKDDTIVYRVTRLLGRIPNDLLIEQSSKDLLEENPEVANEPVVKFSSSVSTYTTKDWFHDQGVDIHNSTNEKILDSIEQLEFFISQFLNNIPTREFYQEPLSIALDLFNSISSEKSTDQLIEQNALDKIANTCAIILRNYNSIENEELDKIKEIVLYCIQTYYSSDKYAEENYSPGSVYSSTPKSNASSALFYLYKRYKSQEIFEIILKYVEDKNAIVRYNIISKIGLLFSNNTNEFWKILKSRLKHESDWFILGQIIRQIHSRELFTTYTEEVQECLTIGFEKASSLSATNSFLENYSVVLLDLYVRTGNETAKGLLVNGISNSVFAKEILLTAFKLISSLPTYFISPEGEQERSRIIDVLSRIVDIYSQELASTVSTNSSKNIDSVKQALLFFDIVIQRVYFALQVNERVAQVNKKNALLITENNRRDLYFIFKPILLKIYEASTNFNNGLVMAHTAYYYIEIMNSVLDYDTKFALSTTYHITEMAKATGYAFDYHSIENVVKITENLLVDHKDVLLDESSFDNLISLLSIYVSFGWPQAIELLWKLDEIFR